MTRFRVLLVPDSIYWVTGTIAKAIADANPWIEPTIVSGPLLGDVFTDADEIAARFDLVHFICPYASRDWLPRLKDRVPVVTSHHHVTSWDLIKHNVDGDAIVAGSAEWVDDLARRSPLAAGRVFRVPYGVDTSLFKPAASGERRAASKQLGLGNASPVIGFFAKRASNDDDRKGTDIFAEAIMLLHKKLPTAGVLIVGPGWQELVGKFRTAGIPVAWLPFVVDSRDIPPLYHALDFYWVTARVEGGPVPLLEAMSSEVCCLSTRVGLAREVVREDGSNGLLLPMNNAKVFADETDRLWNDDAKRQAMGKAARETMVNEMDSRDMAKMFREVYESAVASFNKRNPAVAAVVPESPESVYPVDSDYLSSLSKEKKKQVEMREALAWSENLIMFQDQKGAALKLIMRAWRDNPTSIEPPRVFLRRFLPARLVAGIVSIKQKS